MRNRFCSIPIAVLLLLIPGCLERKEHITIQPDGGVKFRIEYTADSQKELDEGDAVPQLDRGWFVNAYVEEADDGKNKYHLDADASFLPGEELPGDYASIRDPYADTNLQFPTTLEIEERRDGMYYHFRRTYKARPWAGIERLQQQLREEIGAFDGREPQEMTITERQTVLKALAKLEVMKFETFARAAFDDIAPDKPQDLWLEMRRGIQNAVEAFDTLRLAELLGAEEGEFDPAELEIEERKVEEKAKEAMRDVLANTSWFGAGATNSFLDRYARHKKYYQVTEDLGDETFEITIEMPGQIVGHNGDESHANIVKWKFTGDFIRDRDQELMVTSRVSY